MNLRSAYTSVFLLAMFPGGAVSPPADSPQLTPDPRPADLRAERQRLAGVLASPASIPEKTLACKQLRGSAMAAAWPRWNRCCGRTT